MRLGRCMVEEMCRVRPGRVHELQVMQAGVLTVLPYSMGRGQADALLEARYAVSR